MIGCPECYDMWSAIRAFVFHVSFERERGIDPHQSAVGQPFLPRQKRQFVSCSVMRCSMLTCVVLPVISIRLGAVETD